LGKKEFIASPKQHQFRHRENSLKSKWQKELLGFQLLTKLLLELKNGFEHQTRLFSEADQLVL
jgi:hypothetical protein